MIDWQHRPADKATLSPSRRYRETPEVVAATRVGVVERNPVKDLDPEDRPSAGRITEPRYLTGEELDSLLERMTDTFRPIAATCALCGTADLRDARPDVGRPELRHEDHQRQ